MAATTTKPLVSVTPLDLPQPSGGAAFPPMQTAPYPSHYGPTQPSYHPSSIAYPAYPPSGHPDQRLPPRLTTGPPPPQVAGVKRGASTQALPGETPPKKKQSKWTSDEDREIIDLRGRGMKWEDISKRLPGRSAISCRLRFQNYLERRSEWDEEKKNKLARLYERFKKDMWEKIAKEMQLPWRAAEAMHWQIGEIEMAQRANVPVFHLAGQQGSAAGGGATGSEGRASTSPTSASVAARSPGMPYTHSHNHSLPQISQHGLGHPLSPIEHFRRDSIDSAPPSLGPGFHHRRRADSMRSVASGPLRPQLPSLDELTGSPAARDSRPKYLPGPSW